MLDIPAPKALPIIGHAHLMIGLNNEGTQLSVKDILIDYSRNNHIKCLIFFSL